MLKHFFRYVIQGVLFIAPIALTIYIVLWLFFLLDTFMGSLLQNLFGPVPTGISILFGIILLAIIGVLAQTIIGKPLKNFLEGLLVKIPLLNILYSALSDLFTSLLGNEKKFSKPVMVKVNHISELEKLGFLTESDLSILGETEKVAVYFPHSYNFSGEMFIVPVKDVRPVDVHPADAMKFIVSGGVSGFPATNT